MPTLTVPYHPPAQTTAQRFNRQLQIAFNQQAAEVGRRLSVNVLTDDDDRVPGMEHWVEHLSTTLQPFYLQLFQQGIVESSRRLMSLRGARPGARPVVYRPPQRINIPYHQLYGISKLLRLPIDFDLFDPRVLRAVDKATLEFCEETNKTAVDDLDVAIKKLRALLKRGLEKGKAIAQLAREVKRIFADQSRAFRIATTETSRAIHGGAWLNAKESSLDLKKEWVASSDACELCQELMEKGPVDLDEPFYTDPKGGAYAAVQYPPRHPHCFLHHERGDGMRPKPLSTQLHEHHRKEEFQAAAQQNMNVAARRGRVARAVPQFTDKEYEKVFKKQRSKK